MRRGVSEKTWTVALSGVLAAMSLALLYLASVLPTGQLGVAAVAGLFPMAAVISAGWKAGACCWLASGLLGLLIVPGKGIALLFLLFPVIIIIPVTIPYLFIQQAFIARFLQTASMLHHLASPHI